MTKMLNVVMILLKAMKREEFIKKLKVKCKKCTENTILVYYRNILRLFRLTNEGDDIPLKAAWILKPALIKKYKDLKIGARRHLSNAAVKFFQLLGKENLVWYKFMMADSQAYALKRSKNEKSETESSKWLKDGWKGVRKAATEFLRREKIHIFDGEKTMKKLYKYQIYIVLRLFSEIPFRNGFATLELKDNKKNFIKIPKKGSIKFVMRTFKNSDQLGEKEITLSRGLTTQVRKFLKYRDGVVDNDYFLNTMNKKKMTRSSLGKMVIRATKKLLNKKIGSRIIRVLAATSNKEEIKKLKKFSDSMLHSVKQTGDYVRKD